MSWTTRTTLVWEISKQPLSIGYSPEEDNPWRQLGRRGGGSSVRRASCGCPRAAPPRAAAGAGPEEHHGVDPG